MRLLKFLVLGIARILGITRVSAGPYEDGLKEYGRGDTSTARKLWSKAADQNHANAHFNLGVSYAQGVGVPKDDQQAVAWYRKAADQGLADAQYNLGVSYADETGVPKDDQQADSPPMTLCSNSSNWPWPTSEINERCRCASGKLY